MSIAQRAMAALVLVYGAVMASAQGDIVQITIPFNVDVVREPGGTVTAGLGFSGEALLSQAEAAARDSVSPKGLPDNGILNGIQLGPYNGNNAIQILPQTSGPQFGTPGNANMVLHILAASGDGTQIIGGNLVRSSNPATLQLYASYANHSDVIFNVDVPNFRSGGGPTAISGMDISGAGVGGFVDNTASIYDITFSGLVNPSLPPFGGVRIANGLSSTFTNLYVFGAYATVPEPGFAAGLMAMALCFHRKRRARGS